MPTTTEILDALRFDLTLLTGPINTSADPAWRIEYQFAGSSQPGDLPIGSYTGWTPLSAAEKATIRAAMDHIETFLNVTFVEVTGLPDPDLNIGKVNLYGSTIGEGGYSYSAWSNGDLASIDSMAVYKNTLDLSDPANMGLILHELGHALTLKHPFEGAATLPLAVENGKYTVMSYDPNPDTGTDPDAMMLYDILALQSRWGTAEHNIGNTTYTGPRTATVDPLWDTGGTDLLDASATSTGVSLDLRQGAFSRWGSFDDMVIPFGVVIENATGGSGDDSLTGNSTANLLSGRGGNDMLAGGGGNDTLRGDAGNDRLFGSAGFDTLRGGDGNDTVVGGNGRDLAFLGTGDDLFLDNAQTGAYGRDTVWGLQGRDTISGGGGNDVFHGGAGSDRILGRKGDDRLFGGDQDDLLVAGGGNDTVAGGNGRDRAFLGDGDDVFFDNAQSRFGHDLVQGGTGRDTIHAGGGNDTLTGGAGADTFIFEFTGFGNDRITDFATGNDQLHISAAVLSVAAIGTTAGPATTAAEVIAAHASVSGSDIVLDLGAAGLVTLAGIGADLTSLEGDIVIF